MPPAKVLDYLTDDQLLDLRFCELPLTIEGTALQDRIARLHSELEACGLNFRPHIWLSEEWFTPDGVPGFAIPFYLAHPRLSKLERRQMLEIEGASQRDCLRIMRHETGHAIDNAFRLHGRRRYRELFGSFRRPYPDSYTPQPNSRDYVLHLPAWYAQAHPAEDFAETFAEWMRPGSRWKKRYRRWPALAKLNYVEELMREMAGRPAVNNSRVRVDELSGIEITLRDHYRKKREHYAFQWPPDYDQDLLRIFSSEPQHKFCPSAAGFLARHRRSLCHEVADGTGAHHYAIDQMLSHMINRCRELKLRVNLTAERTRQKVLVSLTIQTMNGIHTGYHRIAL
ncbi:MAG: putative zinc-binding metallopeptidase [Blastocatellia bacterium]